ncbi:MAG: hypothetical protein IPG08_08205 [Sphingobacteriaceae bacterium]|nr:hypothetical protein [Sphingobacteriaceae bacterium]
MNKAIAYIFNDYRKQKNARLFKNLLYGFLIIKCVLWLLNFDILFGEHAVSLVYNEPIGFFKQFAYLIYLSKNSALACGFIFTVLLLSLYSLFDKRSYVLTDLIIYLLVLNLDIRIYTTTTAGESILVNLCFLSSWLRKDFNIGSGVYDKIKIVLHNVSYLALILQVCILYGFSALAKWYDADWLSGEVVYLTSKAQYYSRSFVINTVDSFHFLTVIITYLVLLYQSLFPFLVWVKSIKRYFLHFGVIMHLYIAFVMGLFFFGWIMVITYVLFYDFKEDNR